MYSIILLPYDKSLDSSNSKAFADEYWWLNGTQSPKFVRGRPESTEGKRAECWLPAFFPHWSIFLNDIFLWPLTWYANFRFFKFSSKKHMMSKTWPNGDTVIWLSRKHCGKRRNCSSRAISPFPTMFSKAVCCWCVRMSIYEVKG